MAVSSRQVWRCILRARYLVPVIVVCGTFGVGFTFIVHTLDRKPALILNDLNAPAVELKQDADLLEHRDTLSDAEVNGVRRGGLLRPGSWIDSYNKILQGPPGQRLEWKHSLTGASQARVKQTVSTTVQAVGVIKQHVPNTTPYHGDTGGTAPLEYPTFSQWSQSKALKCDGHFVGYGNEFASLYGATIDLTKGDGRPGGENIASVLGQDEKLEYYTFRPGFFVLPCEHFLRYQFSGTNHLNTWLDEALETTTRDSKQARKANRTNCISRQFTLAITRYEYVNIYHTMTDWYNAFLLMQFYNKTAADTHVLFVDGHPLGGLDQVWRDLFGTVTRVSALCRRTVYTHLVWAIQGYNSALLQHDLPSVPFTEEFRNFFFRAYRLKGKQSVNCTRLQITFLWRRDYVAHPRNPSGLVQRKILNERALLQAARQTYPQHAVRGVQIDRHSMAEQLRFIAATDLLVGMHGAGLTFALMLPVGAGLVELYPNYWSTANEHFKAIARWRRLHYRQWENEDPRNELPNHKTRIPIVVIKVLLKQVIREMCPSTVPINL